ncbi:MAG: serine hydrolase [Rhodospirillaceae bacterium]|nr:serine hydrolase [Rhodospirillaceae bacterium]
MKRFLLAAVCAPGLAFAQMPAPAPMPPEVAALIKQKMDWVKEVEAQDYNFWFRYANMPDQSQFRQGQEWYNPMALVDGGLRPYLPTAAEGEAATIDAAALDKAGAYAMERETQAFIVYHQGKIRYQRYMPGYTDTSAISSHSWVKTLHGILFGFALADGKIKSLDEPVENYVTEWKDDPRGKITIRQMLWNTSGIEDADIRNPDPITNLGIQMVEGSDVTGAALAHKLKSEPGTTFNHNNVTTQILGLILTRATGTRFDKYLSEKLWRPVGAQRGALRMDKPYNGNVVSYCCFLSAPSDWMRVAHLLMNDGKLPDGTQLLPKGWVAEMKKGSGPNPNYGLHIWVDAKFDKLRPYNPAMPTQFANTHSEPFAANDIFYFDGGGKVRIWMSPKLDLIVLRMGFPPPRGKDFDEAFMPNAVIRGIKKG